MAQIALAVVLLMGAGLMMKSLLRLLHANVGFDSENVLTMTVVAPTSKYKQPAEQVEFFDRLKEGLRSLPGTSTLGTVDKLPLQGGNTSQFHIEGDPVPPPGQETEANVRVVDENYFQTLGIPLISGRTFDQHDGPKTPGVVIISRTTADKVFSGRDPIGRRIVYGSSQSPPDLIVGVVGDVKVGGLDDAIRPVLYYPFRQNPTPGANLVFRTTADPLALTNAIRNQVQAIDSDAAIFNVNTVSQLISGSPAAFMRRFPGLVITIFAVLALLLSGIGIYGVVSYSVSQQTHHIGVRMALGARGSDIIKLVLRQGLVIALSGIAIGLAGAFALMRLLRTLLFEVQTNDAGTYAVVVGTLFVIALLACYLPARRATKVDPLVALRYE
jgi:putative ABC transport system permease protein